MKKGKYVLLVAGIFFLVPLIFWGFEIKDHFNNMDIVKNGIEVEATVVDFHTNVTVNDENYYYVNYVFYDKDGNLHKGKTSTCYILYEVADMQTIKIKYDEQTFESIQANYSFADIGETVWILPLISSVGVAMIVTFVVIIVKEKKDNQLLQSGKLTKATYVNCQTGMEVNGMKYYKVLYTFRDNTGKVRNAKSGSIYTYRETLFFAQIGQFDIKYNEKRSVIAEKIDLSILTTKKNDIQAVDHLKKCAYCGATLELNRNKCPSCGSREFRNE